MKNILLILMLFSVSFSFAQSMNRAFDTTADFGVMNLRLSIARKF